MAELFPLDQSKFLLTVSGTPVDLSVPTFNLESFSVSYDSKELVFTELASPGYGNSTYQNEDSVTLQMNLGSGMKTWFRGKIRRSVHAGTNHAERIEYSCVGYQNIASELDLLGVAGIPSEGFAGGATLKDVVNAIFILNASQLSGAGIPSGYGIPSYTNLGDFLIQDVSLENAQLIPSIKQLISTVDPAKRIFFDDLQNAWIFPDIKNADIKIINIDLADLDSHTYTISTDNRFTAILGTAVTTIPSTGSDEYIISLTPDWEAQYQSDWTFTKGSSAAVAKVFGDSYTKVFRQWSFPPQSINSLMGFVVMVYTRYWFGYRWVPIKAQVDWTTGKVVANVPIILAGNPHKSGDAKPPLGAALVYSTFKSQPVPASAQLRVPASGYAGTAYTKFGIQRVKQLIVDPAWIGYPPYLNAQLELLQDAVITAELPLYGDPIESLLNLQVRVRLTDTTRLSGIDTIDAMLMKYTYKFGVPGKSTLSLTTDKTSVVKAIK